MAGEETQKDMELRLNALADRISMLKASLRVSSALEKVEALGEIHELDQRRAAVKEQFENHIRSGRHWGQDSKAAITTIMDDLFGAVEDYVMWIDKDFSAAFRPRGKTPPSK